MKIVLLAGLALFAFAGNSILCRLALADNAIDPATFTSIRVVSGAIVLMILLKFKLSRSCARLTSGPESKGSWSGAISLFTYAALFSFAYVALDTATGALILFGAVQLTMMGTNLVRGNRPKALEWTGLVLACVGLVYLLWPQANTPNLSSALMMLAAGVAWAVYTLNGRGSKDPLADTASNFVRAVPFALLLIPVFATQLSVSGTGVLLALVSGALTSGIGYAIWYATLPALTTTQAAVIQLLVPVIAAFGGVVLVDESVSLRLVIASAMVFGGILLVILTKPGRKHEPQRN